MAEIIYMRMLSALLVICFGYIIMTSQFVYTMRARQHFTSFHCLLSTSLYMVCSVDVYMITIAFLTVKCVTEIKTDNRSKCTVKCNIQVNMPMMLIILEQPINLKS